MSTMTRWNKTFVAVAIVTAICALPILSAQAQQTSPGPQQPAQPPSHALSQQQLQQLVAPIALYPDTLLAQVLTASTYPLEVAMAARWSEKNPDAKGSALEDAMQKQPWDPSVKGLTAVPQVLAMMNEKLDWTSQLGEAFLAQPDDIQNAIQALRKQAEATGNLKSGKEQKVSRMAAPPSSGYVGPAEYIAIEPIDPDYIYVPVYDPVVVYGPSYWPPAYVPFFWHPPWWTVGPVFGFSAALFVGPALWYHYNWGHAGFAAIQTNTLLYGKFNKVNVSSGGQFQNWKFNPSHHGGVQFKNTNLQQQFGNIGSKNLQPTQSGKAIQGIQGAQTKSIQGVQSGKAAQSIQSAKHFEGVQTGKKLETGQNLNKNKTTKMVSSQRMQINQTSKGTGQNVQGGGKVRKKGPH